MTYEKQFIDIDGTRMAYIDVGEGDPVVFLHGNPTSSYLWRNIIPWLEPHARCIAPDLVGMGDSDKLPNSGPNRYTFMEHRHYLDALLDKLCPDQQLTLVIHDWGSVLGFHWAHRHPERVRGIAYMEGIVGSYAWEEFGDRADIFKQIRSPEGEALMLEQNLFVELILPSLIQRQLTEEEMAAYRAPFTDPGESRRPTLSWPRQIPISGEPAEVVELVDAYADWLEHCDIPKLFINAEPGAAISGPMEERCRRWANQQEVLVKGLHFIQEDSPDEIGQALQAWYRELS